MEWIFSLQFFLFVTCHHSQWSSSRPSLLVDHHVRPPLLAHHNVCPRPLDDLLTIIATNPCPPFVDCHVDCRFPLHGDRPIH